MYLRLTLCLLFIGFTSSLMAQKRGGKGPGGGTGPGGMPDESVPVGAGIAWYTDWEQAKQEAKRSKRPILFMAATSQCGGVPGVF